MESALAIVIIGTGVFAMLRLLAAGTSSNQAGAELTTAVNLANNIHEVIIRLPFYDPDTAARHLGRLGLERVQRDVVRQRRGL